MQHYCLTCADAASDVASPVGIATGEARLSVASLLIVGGLVLGLIGISVDQFGLAGVGGRSGFGWQQQAGVGVGSLFVVLGALLQVDLIAVGGTILFGFSAFADLFGVWGSAGIGWKQRCLILLGVTLTLWGVVLRYRASAESGRRAL